MLANRRVKIVATIGPATQSREALKTLIQCGMNVARLNFSHGTHEVHESVIRNLRELSHELNAPVTILQDLQGPKIRVGTFESGSIELKKGEKVVISPDFEIGKPGQIPTDFPHLAGSCVPGMKILLDDGLLELSVNKVEGSKVFATVVYGGILKNRKGMNIPGAQLPIECLTEKDRDDLEFGLKQKVDYIALSFVRTGNDIRTLRSLIEAGGETTRIVAKIEMLEALENLEEIVRLSDAVMVARGDLAIEVGQTLLPSVQKDIIRLCNSVRKPVITATQMLDSMVENPRPTRAEITDIANAVLDGSDALMLSAETASGKYPFKCVRTMHDIIMEVGRTTAHYYNMTTSDEFLTTPEAIGASACLCALKLNASAIVCLTTTGKTATIISGFRPRARIIAVTHIVPTLNRLELVWGIQTFQIPPYQSSHEAMSRIEDLLLKYGLVKTGERVVLTLGFPVLQGGKTNTLRVYTVGGEDVRILPEFQLPLRCKSNPLGDLEV